MFAFEVWPVPELNEPTGTDEVEGGEDVGRGGRGVVQRWKGVGEGRAAAANAAVG
jgi:hypothetical protein